MPLQVGLSCFDTPVSAGEAACSSFTPVSSIDASGVRSVSCSGADPATGALILSVATTPTGGATTYTTVEQQLAFPDCFQSNYIQAAEQLFGVLLAAWAITYGAWKVLGFIKWNRGDHV